MDPWLGRLVDSRYRVIARIGQGGMGIVYKVEHQRMGKIAAMKVLHRELAGDREVVKRFRREAEAVSKLTHHNAVQTFDFGTTDGALYLVMEYVRGEDLSAILRRDGPLPFRRAGSIFVQMCGALAEAHELGIVHRDLKPENVLVTRSKEGLDHVKVLDFGLATIAERDEPTTVTDRGLIVGTPHYMSPEQIRGEALDHRSDIYSLGAMMYRVLTAEVPFQAHTPVGILTKHLTDPVVPPRQRRPDLDIRPSEEAIVLRAMAKQRDARYSSADEVRHDLEQALHFAEQESTRSLGKSLPAQIASHVAVEPAHTPVRISGLDERRHADEPGAKQALGREDFDAFERSLRRRTVVRTVAVPSLLILASAGTVGVWRWNRQRAREVENEPNNDLARATLVAADLPVRGKIGQRLGEDASDRDYYRLTLPTTGDVRRFSAHVTPIRNLDLAVAVYDRAGTLLAAADNEGLGRGEVVPNLGVCGDLLYVAVFESKEALRAHTPTENITDEYQLTLSVASFAVDEEREPNESDVDATPISPDRAVHGTLGRLRDVDRYRFEGPSATYVIEVTGDSLPTLRIAAGDGAAVTGRQRTMPLVSGGLFAIERADQEKPNERPTATKVDAPYAVVVRRHP